MTMLETLRAWPAFSLEEVTWAGADDVVSNEEVHKVTCAPEAFNQVLSFLEKADLHPDHSEITYVPRDTIEIKDVNTARKAMKLIDALDEHEDIQTVSANFTQSALQGNRCSSTG